MINFPENVRKKDYLSVKLYNQAFREGAKKAMANFEDSYTGESPEQLYAVTDAGHAAAKQYISDIKKQFATAWPRIDEDSAISRANWQH